MNDVAGWYQDPEQPPGHLRYWDGRRWTEFHLSPPPGSTGTTAANAYPAGTWFGRHKILAAVVAVLVVVLGIGVATGDEPTPEGTSTTAGSAEQAVSDDSDGEAATPATQSPGSPTASPAPTHTPDPATEPMQTVTRVVDGDTLELEDGATVRLVGIDTPERGECGHQQATRNLERMVLGKRVSLRTSDEDQDAYGRLLRYVEIGGVDAGLGQLQRGLAVARYDSRDGYGFHPREPRYIDADAASEDVACPKPTPAPTPEPNPEPIPEPNPAPAAEDENTDTDCTPGYSPCLPPASDYDCAGGSGDGPEYARGPIRVTGSDPYDLDREGDGVACE